MISKINPAQQQVAKLTAVMAIIQAQVKANPVPVLQESITLIEVLNNALKNISSLVQPTPKPFGMYSCSVQDTIANISRVLAKARADLDEANSTRLPALADTISEIDIYNAYIAGFTISAEGFNAEYGCREQDLYRRFKLYAKQTLTDTQWSKIKEVINKWP